MEAEQNTRLFGNGDTHGTTGLTLCLFMGNVFPLTSSSSSQLKREVPVYKGRGPGLNSRRFRSVASACHKHSTRTNQAHRKNRQCNLSL